MVTPANQKPAKWDDKNGWNHTYYRVTIRKDNKSASFDFWGSRHDYEAGEDPSTQDAISSWALDCMMGNMEFKDFCGEFGYSTDSMEAHKTWKACKKAMSQANHLGFFEEEMSKYTAGPWSVDGNTVYTTKSAGWYRGKEIRQNAFSANIQAPEDELQANARLIASAPELLEALQGLAKEINLSKLNIKKDFSLINAHAAALKAIYKAKGD
jgi:hypothetical protein